MWGDVLSRVSAGGGQSLPTAFLDEAQFQWLSLRQLDGRDRPLTILPLNRNPQPVEFVKPNFRYGPGLSITEDYGLADKFILGLLEFAEDRRGTVVWRWHR